jgi:hypothetical protein
VVATIELMTSDEAVLGGGRYGTDASGYRAVRRRSERTWAVERCQGIGRHIARRLLADGEHVVDFPPKLSARTRVFATGQGRKTDATDAHSFALAATRMTGLRPVIDDEQGCTANSSLLSKDRRVEVARLTEFVHGDAGRTFRRQVQHFEDARVDRRRPEDHRRAHRPAIHQLEHQASGNEGLARAQSAQGGTLLGGRSGSAEYRA